VNQGQATQPGTPSYCLTWTHTIYQTAHSIEIAAPTQDIVRMGGGSGDGMPSEVLHLRKCNNFGCKNDTTMILAEG